MSNHHLRSKEISLKAKGLLSVMLSLPEDWNYKISGLSEINKEGIDSIRTALIELEKAGYIERRRCRDAKGRLRVSEYIIREKPIEPKLENPTLENSMQDDPVQDRSMLLSKEEIKKEKINTDQSNTDSFFPSSLNEGKKVPAFEREKIQKQIEYTCLLERYNRRQLDELVEIMLEVAMHTGKVIRIGRDQEYPREYVQERFSRINALHIERVMDGIEDNIVPVKNTKAYLLSVLFNSVSTIDHYYTIQAKTEF